MKKFLTLLVTAAPLVFLSTRAHAQYWNVSGGDNKWETASNWNTSAVPTSATFFGGSLVDNVTINLTTASQATNAMDINGSGATSNGNNRFTLNITGAGSLNIGAANSSFVNGGTTDVNGGTVLCSNAWNLGSYSSGPVNTVGTWNLQAGTQTISKQTVIQGGTFTVSGGAFTTGRYLQITSGTMVVQGSSASITANSGSYAAGAFQITGGTLSEVFGSTGISAIMVSGQTTGSAWTLGGALTANLSLLSLSADNQYHPFTLINTTGTTVNGTGVFSGPASVTLGANMVSADWSFSPTSIVQTNNGTYKTVYLDVMTVPEPATWALLAFSLTTVMVLRRRSRA